MPSVHETAYPRLKSSHTTSELTDSYTPTSAETEIAEQVAKGQTAKLCFIVLLKTFQRLGYFVLVRDVPPQIITHIARSLPLFRGEYSPDELAQYDNSGTRRRHIPIIRARLSLKPFDREAHALLSDSLRVAAQTKEDLADIINVGIEELIRARRELPGFSTLQEEAQRCRAEVNRAVYRRVSEALGVDGRRVVDEWLKADETTRRSGWNALKSDPGKPTLAELREMVAQLKWLMKRNIGATAFGIVPDVKIQHFAAEAKSLDAARINEMESHKRYTLAAALIKTQVARTLDDLGEMFVKRMKKIHLKGQAALADFRMRHQSRTDGLIELLQELLTTMQQEGTAEERLTALLLLVGHQPETIIEDCQAYTAYAGDNYAPFLWRFYKSHRQTLFEWLDQVRLVSTSQDASLENALDFLRAHRYNKADRIIALHTKRVAASESSNDSAFDAHNASHALPLDLSWIPDKWWKLVTGISSREVTPMQVDRRHFEVCLFSQLMWELKSGDLCIVDSDKFADYREQLISWEEYAQTIAAYGEQVELPTEAMTFVAETRRWLEEVASATDSTFPANEMLHIEDGVPILRRLEKKSVPVGLKELEAIIADRLEPVGILDAITDTERWLNWTSRFGPLSGYEAKIGRPRERYIAASFCYGCGLGPTQTARSLEELDRRQVAWVNQRHITEEKLDEIITEIVNAYNLFTLPKQWGSGKSASADGTKWDIDEQNLLSEYHIRYGGYGGIGYYHVSDTYVALFSHFIPCGVWEAVYILDGLLKNKSDIQPDTLHADTQGQSTPVFGLAHLLGINLMPRIRNWKDLKLFRPVKKARYTHIDELFSESVNWEVIETHLPDMLRVVLSIEEGRITASTLLRKLGTYSRKNKLYVAMRELGRVVRTVFLLKYLSDPELRRTIQAATNKSEAFNKFIQWVSFGGGGLIAENDRDEQRKLIKYNHLVANCLIFHNVYSLTGVLHDLAREGYEIEEEAVARLSPYLTEHINRFGKYTLNLQRETPAPDYNLTFKAASA